MKYKLSDICDVKVGFPFKSELFNENGDGIRLVRGMNVSCAGFRWGNQTRWWNYYTKDLEKYLLKEEDVLIAMDGNVSTNFVQVTKDDLPLLLVQRVARLRAKNVPQKIVWYIVKSHEFGAYLDSVKTGTTISHISAKQIGDYEIDLPDYLTQEKISSILSILDDKIRLNNKINNNLMQQIQSLFSDWFVTFTPFGGNKPSSWNKTDIYAISKVIYGAPFASKAFNTERNGVPIIRIRDLKEQQFVTYTTETHPKGYLLKPGDVVVGMDGEFRPYIWGNDKAWLNQRVCVFENKRPNGKAFLYCVIKPLLYAIEQTQVGTTVIHIGKKDFDSFEFWLPEDCVLDKFDSLTNPMYQQIVFSLLENKKLMVLRDTLLPKLLSGEINVSDIEL